jgi:hypothetical protein
MFKTQRLVTTLSVLAMLLCLSVGQVVAQEPKVVPQDKEVQAEPPKLKVPVPPVGEAVEKLNASHEGFKRAFAGLKSVKLPSKQATLEDAREAATELEKWAHLIPELQKWRSEIMAKRGETERAFAQYLDDLQGVITALSKDADEADAQAAAGKDGQGRPIMSQNARSSLRKMAEKSRKLSEKYTDRLKAEQIRGAGIAGLFIDVNDSELILTRWAGLIKAMRNAEVGAEDALKEIENLRLFMDSLQQSFDRFFIDQAGANPAKKAKEVNGEK